MGNAAVALTCRIVVSNPAADIELQPLSGEPRALGEMVTMFHLALVVVDPFTQQSAWILSTASRILSNFSAADVRVGFVVTGTPDEAHEFLGPLVDEFVVYADPERTLVESLGLEVLPAWVHIDHLLQVEASAQGWDPDEWRAAAEHLADRMSWTRPTIPVADDPVRFNGSPALA